LLRLFLQSSLIFPLPLILSPIPRNPGVSRSTCRSLDSVTPLPDDVRFCADVVPSDFPRLRRLVSPCLDSPPAAVADALTRNSDDSEKIAVSERNPNDFGVCKRFPRDSKKSIPVSKGPRSCQAAQSRICFRYQPAGLGNWQLKDDGVAGLDRCSRRSPRTVPTYAHSPIP